MATDKGSSRNETWHWTNDKVGIVDYGVGWTHGLITKLVRASERNSVAVISNPTQANFP